MAALDGKVGQFPTGTWSVQIDDGTDTASLTFDVAETSVITVLRSPSVNQTPNTARTFDKILGAADFGNYSSDTGYWSRTAKIQELVTGTWTDRSGSGTPALGTENIRVHVTVQPESDEFGTADGDPEIFISPAVDTVASVAPDAPTANAVTFGAARQSNDGTEADITSVEAIPEANTAPVVRGRLWLASDQAGVGMPVSLTGTTVVNLAADTLNQSVVFAWEDSDGVQSTKVAQNDQGDTVAGSATLAITLNRTSGTAPMGLVGHAEATGLEGVTDTFLEPRYVWSIQYAGTESQTHDGAWLPWDDDLTVSHGPQFAAAIWPEPSDFGGASSITATITCQALSRAQVDASGASAVPVSNSVNVTVNNPDTVFAGNKTACVTTTGAATGDEPSGAQIFATIADAMNGMRSFNEWRLLLHTDQVHWNENSDVLGSDTPTKLLVDKYGTGQWPIVSHPIGVGNGTPDEFMHGRIRVFTEFDSTLPYSCINLNLAIYPKKFNAPQMCTFARSDIRGGGVQFSIKENWVMHDCFTSHYQNYGVFVDRSGHDYGFHGWWSKQHALSVKGYGRTETRAPWLVNHANYRSSALGINESRGFGIISFDLCDLIPSPGWGGGYSQPPLRIGRSADDQENPWIEYANLNRLITNLDAGLGSGFTEGAINIRKYLWDHIYMAFGHYGTSDGAYSNGSPGPHMRNCIAVIANAVQLGNGGFSKWLRTSPQGKSAPILPEPGVADAQSISYANTLIDLRTSDKRNSMQYTADDAGWFGGVYAANDIVMTPNRSTSGEFRTDDTDLVSTAVKSPVITGKSEHCAPFDPQYANPNEFGLWQPQATSSAVGDREAGERYPVDDFFCNLRLTDTRGALEPTS